MMSDMPPYVPPRQPEPPAFPAGKRELIFGAALLICTLAVCNFTALGGFNLGFSIGVWLCVGCSAAYLWRKGQKKGYALTVLGLCLLMAAGFARSDDDFVKVILLGFLFVGVNLGLTLLAGRERWSSGSAYSLLDGFRSFFGLGLGKLEHTFRGTRNAIRKGGRLSRNATSVLLGLVLALPVLILLVTLLIRADAAFDGLMRMLPEFRLEEVLLTVWLGGMLFPVLYSRGLGLRLDEVRTVPRKNTRGLSVLTLNTVLVAVCAVYLVYLFSQLAYFVGGFAGLLPEEFTLAEYARRGFFEMAWLSAINLTVIVCAVALCDKKEPVPLLTRLLCLFIGVVTVFFVATASAKMFLYIGSYGLTRLRVLTQIIMLFLGLTTGIVCTWLFVPKLRYMQVVLLAALVIGCCVIWADVDSQVARYNVEAYLEGKLETVDVHYLGTLGDGAMPWLRELTQSAHDPDVAQAAWNVLRDDPHGRPDDFREWNYVNYKAAS